jgi:plastocyanin/mono/diheme cytochrome c family protein
MDRREIAARIVLGLILVGLPAAALGYQYGLRPATADTRVIDIRAAVPEDGGFAPDAIRVAVGERVTLRFASVDVTHGVAIGPGLGVDLGHVDPGQVKDITLTFDHPGTYAYYCNTWCSRDHWRMRGTIQVIDPTDPGLVITVPPDPVIAALVAEGVDIDATPHAAGSDPIPEHDVQPPPSAQRGASLFESLVVPAELIDQDWRRSHTPTEAADLLSAQNPNVPQGDLIDAVAYLWTRESSPETLIRAEQLYNKNCAACHGQSGGGDGPAAGTTVEKPVAFADPAYMFERRSDVLYAKLRRGGMGTGMPNYGTLFTPEETWALVDYLWTLTVALPDDAD